MHVLNAIHFTNKDFEYLICLLINPILIYLASFFLYLSLATTDNQNYDKNKLLLLLLLLF